MPLPPRMGDEELGKKDDEYRPGTKSNVWQSRQISGYSCGPPRRYVKRVFWLIVAAILVYVFVKNLEPMENPKNMRPNYQHTGNGGPMGSKPPANKPQPPKGVVEVVAQRTFNGPIKFYQLASTLHAAGRPKGSSLINENVLFAAASLKSAATLLPIACEMALRERNRVHFALMGRDDIPMDILKSVNGITKDCSIIYHDARPDFPTQSTEFRMEVSSSAAFNHINTFVHPQATFVDGSGEEELSFLKGLKYRAVATRRTVIELPEYAEQSMMWLTLLNAASLATWNKATVDLVVHAQPSASGSLMRLLESLKRADYFSSTPPRLTIELPHTIDEPTKRYLENFKWPPRSSHNNDNLLTLHHRIPQHSLSGDESSARFLESFWPANPTSSHVLILSPQAELSPLFFHYLKYTMLEYKYSSTKSNSNNNLLGISLDLPSTYLNDSTTFSPPATNETEMVPFLWQAPNSNAALYFGDKWVEMHGFISEILASKHKLPTATTLNAKEVSKTYPSWLEHILKLARARAYVTVYPNFGELNSLVTLHNELYQPPEEYNQDIQEKEEGEMTGDANDHLSLNHKEKPLVNTGLLSVLKDGGQLPKINQMPIMRYDGEIVTDVEMNEGADEFASIFRREIGGCKEEVATQKKLERKAGEVGDLFCLD